MASAQGDLKLPPGQPDSSAQLNPETAVHPLPPGAAPPIYPNTPPPALLPPGQVENPQAVALSVIKQFLRIYDPTEQPTPAGCCPRKRPQHQRYLSPRHSGASPRKNR